LFFKNVRKKMFVLTDAAACISTRKKVNVQKGKGPALPALTAHVDSTVALTMKKSTTQSIDAGDALALLAADEDGASSATTSNNGHREFENSNPVAHDDLEVDDDPEGDMMPQPGLDLSRLYFLCFAWSYCSSMHVALQV
jgi:hypothetical protein